ncbi:hypothetical protein GPALN_010918, partial [Globodera pallida]
SNQSAYLAKLSVERRVDQPTEKGISIVCKTFGEYVQQQHRRRGAANDDVDAGGKRQLGAEPDQHQQQQQQQHWVQAVQAEH